MKALWALLAAVVLAGVAALVWPAQTPGTLTQAPVDATEAAKTTAPTAPVAQPAAKAVPKPPPAQPTAPAVPAAPTTKPSAATAPAAAPTPAAPPAGGLPIGLDRTIAHARVMPGRIVKQADGALLADGKYRIEGQGTKEEPYRVTWDLLASCSRTYVPRLKEDRIPQWIAMLDGAWIRIDGYVAFPLMLQESTEVLVMLNQWDGCCIGVPPTPYDAIEVKLLEPVKPAKRHTFNFGSLTGRLRVDPLLVENWLVGMYRMEEASLTQDGL